MALATIAAIGGSIVLIEGLMALLEHIQGDPEADVTVALQQLAAKNQRRAFATAATEQLGREHLESKFTRFQEAGPRALTQAALDRAPQPALEPGGELLDMISQRLGISPEVLSRASSPSRMGDMSGIYRQMGTTPPGA